MLAAKLKGIFPKRLVPWVVQPELITLGLDLSPLLAEKRDILADLMAEELPAGGHVIIRCFDTDSPAG